MKFFVGLLIVSLASGMVLCASAPQPPKVGTTLQDGIASTISTYFFQLEQELLKLVPGNTRVNYKKFLDQLESLAPKTELEQVMGAIYAQTNASIGNVASTIPTAFLKADVSVERVVSFITNLIPSSVPESTTGALTILLTNVSSSVATEKLIDVLNKLQ